MISPAGFVLSIMIMDHEWLYTDDKKRLVVFENKEQCQTKRIDYMVHEDVPWQWIKCRKLVIAD